MYITVITFTEEEMKRLNEALQANSYGAVAFNYDGQQNIPTEANGQEESTTQSKSTLQGMDPSTF